MGEKILTNNKKKNDKNFTPQRVHSSSTFETRLLVEIWNGSLILREVLKDWYFFNSRTNQSKIMKNNLGLLGINKTYDKIWSEIKSTFICSSRHAWLLP